MCRGGNSLAAPGCGNPVNRRSLVVLAGAFAALGLAGVVDLYGIDTLAFYTRGEPREALVVQGMVSNGDWILPMRGPDEIAPKPPFFHWLGATASLLRGDTDEFAVRLPSALLAITITGLVFFLGARWSRIRSGWLAAMSLSLSFEWLRAARTARVDMAFTAFVTMALLLYATIDRSGPGRARIIAFYAALAAATLTKGPAGLVLPLLVIFVFNLVRPVPPEHPRGLGVRVARLTQTARAIRIVPGLLAVMVVVGAWYTIAGFLGGEPFLETHLFREHLFRVLDAERYQSGHSHGVFYLFGQFLLGAFPWSLFVPALAWWLWNQRPLDDTKRFLVVWFCVVFLFFLVPDSKRGVYLLPLYPAGALLFGMVLGPGPEGVTPRRLAAGAWITGCATLALLGVAGLIVASGLPLHQLVLPYLRPHEAAEVIASVDALRNHLLALLAASALALLGSALAAQNARGAHWLRASVPFTIAMLAVLGGLVAPVERAIAERRTFSGYMPRVAAQVGDAALAFGDDAFDYGALFYARRPIERNAQARRSAAYLLVPAEPAAQPTDPTRAAAARPHETEDLLCSIGTGVRGRGGLCLVRNETPDQKP